MRKYITFLRRRIIIYWLRNKPYRTSRGIHKLNLPFEVKLGEQKRLTSTSIFGTEVQLDQVEWQRDYKSGFTYPLIKSEKIKYHLLYNRGIDVVFPWQLSHFHFAVNLAMRYASTNDAQYYLQFKTLTTDWITRNPFLYGINWVGDMDVSIRACCWITAYNLFGEIFFQDRDFYRKVSVSLSKHLAYIDHLLWYSTANNHRVSQYCGLLLVALSLSPNREKSKTIRKAMAGLEACLSTQVLEDGTNFESAIGYHRLVLEMFGWTTLIARNNGLEFPDNYYQRLFKMFEFTAAYMDSNGNAPQIGDNDSGHFLLWDTCTDQDHRFLIRLGEAIFDHTFSGKADQAEPGFHFSTDHKVTLSNVGITPLPPAPVVGFTSGGYYILQNDLFHLLVFCSEKTGGHRHFDLGSFTLSYKGTPVVVDPGSYVYTSDLQTRCQFRDYYAHNLYIEKGYRNPADSFFGIHIDRTCRVIRFSASELVIETVLSEDTVIQRLFLLTDTALHIHDRIESSKDVESYLHFPKCRITAMGLDRYLLRPDLRLTLSSEHPIQVHIDNYDYSPSYGTRVSCPQLCVSAKNNLFTSFTAI